MGASRRRRRTNARRWGWRWRWRRRQRGDHRREWRQRREDPRLAWRRMGRRGPHLRSGGCRRNWCYGRWARGSGRWWRGTGRCRDASSQLRCRAWSGRSGSPAMGAPLQRDQRKRSDQDKKRDCGCAFGGPQRCCERKPSGLPWHGIGPSLRAVARRGILSAARQESESRGPSVVRIGPVPIVTRR